MPNGDSERKFGQISQSGQNLAEKQLDDKPGRKFFSQVQSGQIFEALSGQETPPRYQGVFSIIRGPRTTNG